LKLARYSLLELFGLLRYNVSNVAEIRHYDITWDGISVDEELFLKEAEKALIIESIQGERLVFVENDGFGGDRSHRTE
jgi:hypothetical protein